MTDEIAYFRRRAAQEAAFAESSDCPNARARHRDLANRYERILKEKLAEAGDGPA